MCILGQTLQNFFHRKGASYASIDPGFPFEACAPQIDMASPIKCIAEKGDATCPEEKED